MAISAELLAFQEVIQQTFRKVFGWMAMMLADMILQTDRC